MSNTNKLCPNCGQVLHPVTELELQGQTGGFDIKHAIQLLQNQEKVQPEHVNFDLEKVLESAEYKDLPIYKQEIIYNHVQDLLPKQKKRLDEIMKKSSKINISPVFLICPMGDYVIPIPDEMVIKDKYIRGSQIDKSFIPNKYSAHNKTLPTTRDQICENGAECVAIKAKRPPEFAFFRRPSGKVMFSCIDCCSAKK